MAHRLAANERWLCASHSYVQRRGIPLTPKELESHSYICIRENNDDVTLWHFRSRDKSASAASSPRQSMRMDPALVTNDGEVARQWAELGLGIVLRSQWDVEAAVIAGRLVRVLSDWEMGRADILALTPSRNGISRNVEQFVSCLREQSVDAPSYGLAAGNR